MKNPLLSPLHTDTVGLVNCAIRVWRRGLGNHEHLVACSCLLVNHKYRMRWKDLFEAPIGNYDVIGLSDEGSFRHREDRAILRSPKAEIKIRRMFERVPQTIDLIFLDDGIHRDPRVRGFIDELDRTSGVSSRDAAADLLPPPSTPSAITLILTHNEGGGRVQLSSWIIAHRFGHALAFSPAYETRFQNVVYAMEDLNSFMRDGWVIPYRELLYVIGRMKSCRDRTLTQSDEIIFELFAQFLIQGRVSFNRLTTETARDLQMRVAELQHHSYVPQFKQEDADRFNEMLEFAEHNINMIFQHIMEAVEGKIVTL